MANGERHSAAPSNANIPPHSPEAERSVLGAIFCKNESLDTVREIGLVSGDFYFDAHQKLFEASVMLSDQNLPVDLVTMTDFLRSRNWFEGIGGHETLGALFEDAFSVTRVASYARMVREKALLRKLILTCSEIASGAYEIPERVEEFVDEAESKIFEVSNYRSGKSFVSLREVLTQNFKNIIHLHESGAKKVVGFGTGFTDFDNLTTGLHGGQVFVLAARPGMGKTSWFISALLHAATQGKAVCALFSLEMGQDELGYRFLSAMTRIDSKRIKTGNLSTRDFEKLHEAVEQLSKSRIQIDDSGSLSLMDLRSKCRRLMAQEKRLDIIVIDYLQLMKGGKAGKESSREQEIATISRGLKELSKEFKVPIIALSQLSRAVENRQDKRPLLSDLRESGSIEQDADIVGFIYRDDYYNKNSETPGVAELIIAKNRHGEQATIRLAWLGEYTLFGNLSPSQAGTPVGARQESRSAPHPSQDVGF